MDKSLRNYSKSSEYANKNIRITSLNIRQGLGTIVWEIKYIFYKWDLKIAII